MHLKTMYLISCLHILLLFRATLATAPIELLFLINSQETGYHQQLSRNLQKDLNKQSLALLPQYHINVHILNEIFNNDIDDNSNNNNTSHTIPNKCLPREWTILYALPQLISSRTKLINDNTRWIIICEDTTIVHVGKLVQQLHKENHAQPLYLGHALRDREPTIIHHFAYFENPAWFPYPLLPAGVVFSLPLFKGIADTVTAQRKRHNRKRIKISSEFSIDASHEMARFIFDNVQIRPTTTTTITAAATARTKATPTPSTLSTFAAPEALILPVNSAHITTASDSDKAVATNFNNDGDENVMRWEKIIMRKASYICPEVSWDATATAAATSTINKECVMHARPTSGAKQCTPIEREQIYFAVKTCHKYHNDRLPIIQSTWAQHAKHIKYFSDMRDDRIPTVDTGVPNVETGHCAKTLQIIRLALRDIEQFNRRQRRLPSKQPYIEWLLLTDDDTLLSVYGVCQILGCFEATHQVYLGERYGYRLHALDGFNYITGGGGIAFSLPTIRLILKHCTCPSPAAPDDMILGSCLQTLQLTAVHSMRFHQARPQDYAPELLQLEPPISFHKFWQLDAVEVYNKWFAPLDRNMLAEKLPSNEQQHSNVADNSVIPMRRAPQTHSSANALTLNDINVPVNVVAASAAFHHHTNKRHIDL